MDDDEWPSSETPAGQPFIRLGANRRGEHNLRRPRDRRVGSGQPAGERRRGHIGEPEIAIRKPLLGPPLEPAGVADVLVWNPAAVQQALPQAQIAKPRWPRPARAP